MSVIVFIRAAFVSQDLNDSSKYSQMFSHWILRVLLGWSARRYHGHRTWWDVLRPSCWKYLRPPCLYVRQQETQFLLARALRADLLRHKFQHSRLWSALFFLLIADSLEKNDWTCPFVSHSSLERSWTTCVSGRSHVRCDLRKIWFPTLCHFSPAQVCFPLWSGYGHSVRPVGLPQSFPRVSRRIGRTYKHFVTVLDSFTKIPSPLQRKFALCNIFFR